MTKPKNKQFLQIEEVLSSSKDLFAELSYVCGEDNDECLPFDEIIAKAEPAPDVEFMPELQLGKEASQKTPRH